MKVGCNRWRQLQPKDKRGKIMTYIQKLDEAKLRSIANGTKRATKYTNLKGRPFESESKFNRGMSSILAGFYKQLQEIDTDSCLPYFIFKLDVDRDLQLHILDYIGVRYETEGISLVDTRKRFQQAEEQFKDEVDIATVKVKRLSKRLKYAVKRSKRNGVIGKYYQHLKKKLTGASIPYNELMTRKKNITPDYGLIGYDTEYQIEPLTDEQRELIRKIKAGELSNDTLQPDQVQEIQEGERAKKNKQKAKNKKQYLKRPVQIKTLLSHQFCIDVHGKRLAFVISTEERFTDEWFLDFLGSVTEKLSLFDNDKDRFVPNNYYIFAHFSLAEASWLDNSKMEGRRQRHTDKNLWKNKREIPRSGKKWKQDTCIVEKARTTAKKGGRKLENPVYSRINLTFADTMDLYPSSLKAAAERCGFIKHELEEGTIENMLEYKANNFEDFCRYGCIDSAVSAAIPLDIHSRFSALYLPFQTRVASYSEKYFKAFYEEHYADYGDWREMLGQVLGYQEGVEGERWMPNKLQRDVLDKWYHGGRNEVKRVGCFGMAYYHDLTSAYPSAAIMMDRDFNLSESRHYWGDEAVNEIERLKKIGPFQPHGVALFCRFKKDKIPMFPAHVSGAITFPRIFHGVATWPEFWVAMELELLEELTVIELTVFEALQGRKLPLDMKRLLEKRKDDKLLFKNLLNYNYGKQIQGVSGTVPFSSITCPALGAYMTGFCRAAIGELANLNKDYFAITTDGFISPHKKLKRGKFNKMVEKELKTIDNDWITIDAVGTKSFFIKTRGYGLYDQPLRLRRKVDDYREVSTDYKPRLKHNGIWEVYDQDLDEKEYTKKAKMGIQGISITEFINQLNAGRGRKKVFPGFSNLEPGEISAMSETEFTINTTFDMKHMPLIDTVDETEFTIDGVTLRLPSFETRPIKDIYEYQHLRELANIKNNKKYKLCQKKGLNEKEICDLLTAHSLNDPMNRKLMMEFRKRLAMKADNTQTTWNTKQQTALQKRCLYNAELAKDLSEYKWLFRNEARVVTDIKVRNQLIKEIMAEMEAATAAYEKKLEQKKT